MAEIIHGSRESDSPAPATTGPTAGRSVLVVDDNVDAADTLVMLLEMLGHEAKAVHNGKAAVEQVHALQPDIVLLDIGLPDLTGYEVARRIRAEHKRPLRLIALTGWGQAEDRQKAHDAGFDEHWTKPVDPDMLTKL